VVGNRLSAGEREGCIEASNRAAEWAFSPIGFASAGTGQHYQVTRGFLENRADYLRRLFAEDGETSA